MKARVNGYRIQPELDCWGFAGNSCAHLLGPWNLLHQCRIPVNCFMEYSAVYIVCVLSSPTCLQANLIAQFSLKMFSWLWECGRFQPTFVGGHVFNTWPQKVRGNWRSSAGERALGATSRRVSSGFAKGGTSIAIQVNLRDKSSRRAAGKIYLFCSPSQERVQYISSQKGATRIFPRKDVFAWPKKGGRKKKNPWSAAHGGRRKKLSQEKQKQHLE